MHRATRPRTIRPGTTRRFAIALVVLGGAGVATANQAAALPPFEPIDPEFLPCWVDCDIEPPPTTIVLPPWFDPDLDFEVDPGGPTTTVPPVEPPAEEPAEPPAPPAPPAPPQGGGSTGNPGSGKPGGGNSGGGAAAPSTEVAPEQPLDQAIPAAPAPPADPATEAETASAVAPDEDPSGIDPLLIGALLALVAGGAGAFWIVLARRRRRAA